MSLDAAPLRLAVLVTCEHGGNRVPGPFRALFREAGTLLESHRGWDPGALPLARALGRGLGAPVHAAEVTRLLVDLNRSPHNPAVFSERTRTLSVRERRALLETYHHPHRASVEAEVVDLVSRGARVLHLGVHSFTPALNGKPRRPDLALLYDPARRAERRLCGAWVAALRTWLPGYRIHRNDPYRGASDGLTTWLRRRVPVEGYLGIEVEVNQRLLDGRRRFPSRLAGGLEGSLREALETLGWPRPDEMPY